MAIQMGNIRRYIPQAGGQRGGPITIGTPPPTRDPRKDPNSPFYVRPESSLGSFLTAGGGGGSWGGGGGSRLGWNQPSRADRAFLEKLAKGLTIDPSAAIASAMPGITEKMTGDFNEAANRLGATGMLGFSQGKMKAGTPYQDLLGQAAKSANLAREEIAQKYAMEAAGKNQDAMLALMEKMGLSGGGGGGGSSSGGKWSGGGGDGGGGDPTRDPSSPWYGDVEGYKRFLTKQKSSLMGEGGSLEEKLRRKKLEIELARLEDEEAERLRRKKYGTPGGGATITKSSG